MTKVLVKVAKPFMYNGQMLKIGDEVTLWDEKAFNHMKVGDIERDEVIINTVRERREQEASKALAAAQKVF